MVGTIRAKGVASVAVALDPGRAFQLLEVRVHLSAAGGAGALTGNLASGIDPAYNLNVLTKDMTAVTDYVFQPTIPMHFDKGDVLNFAWANAGGKTYGVEIKYNPL